MLQPATASRNGAARRAGAQRGRFRPAGVGILAVGVLLLVFALQSVRGGSHPLAAVADFDLCARLGPQPAAALPALRATPTAKIPGMGATHSATCYWPIAEARGGAPARHLWLVLTTQATSRLDGNHGGTARFVELFLEETRATGVDVTEAQGPWKRGATIGSRGGDELQLLAEDDGVVLWLSARGVERADLVVFAAAAATRLRGKA